MIASVVRQALVAVPVLLLSLGTAHAECAWVLWEEYESTDTRFNSEKSWAIQVARPSHPACEEVLRRVWQTVVSQWQPSPEKPGIKETKSAPGLVIVNFKGKDDAYGGGFTKKFVCLPDTIDPRGPKGR